VGLPSIMPGGPPPARAARAAVIEARSTRVEESLFLFSVRATARLRGAVTSKQGGETGAPAPRSRRRAAVQLLIGGYASMVLLTIQGLVLVPLYLLYLGPRLYGAWLGTGDIVAWLGMLDLGVASYMTQRIAAAFGEGDEESIGAYLLTGLAVQVALVTVLVLLGVGLSGLLPGWMGLEGVDASVLSGAFIVGVIGMGLGILGHGTGAFAVALQRPVVTQVAAVVGSIVSIVTTVALLLLGFGLWALAIGICARNLLILLANSIYAVMLYRGESLPSPRVSRRVLREVVALSGPALLAVGGNSAAGRSEAALIAILIRPEAATVYVLTRRAAEIASMFLARLGGAVFAGFANLVGTGDRRRASSVLREVEHIYLAAGVLMMAVYLAMNQTFMLLWVGEEQYGGQLLTMLLGISILVAGYAALVLYLYGATGRIAESAYLTFGEAVARVALMAGLLLVLGLWGLPLAVLLTTIPLSMITIRRLGAELGEEAGERVMEWRSYAGMALLLAVAAVAGLRVWAVSWAGFVRAVLAGVAFASIILIGVDRRSRQRARGYLSGMLASRAAGG
jgi:O-antigen/teichoic acid export membrane protein